MPQEENGSHSGEAHPRHVTLALDQALPEAAGLFSSVSPYIPIIYLSAYRKDFFCHLHQNTCN